MKTSGHSKKSGVHLFDKKRPWLHVIFVLSSLLMLFQNCSQNGEIILKQSSAAGVADLSVCGGISCTLDPITKKTAVTTILLALGDAQDSQLVINGASSQLIAETVIRYTSPVPQPKILVVQDHNIANEDPEDTTYVSEVLLRRYNPQFMVESDSGLKAEDVQGFDVVWFNNPGHPMTSKTTYETLLNFEGGVVLQGDDLGRGADFSMQGLTHVKYIDNGTDPKCEDGKTYHHDDNEGNQYRVSLDSEKMPTPNAGSLEFRYGNDIDLVDIASQDVEILATALPGPSVCKTNRPAIVRYMKN